MAGVLTGPTFRFSEAFTANEVKRPLSEKGWIYRRLPFPAAIAIAVNNTDANVTMELVIGSDQVVAAGTPVPAGGTAGVFPNQEADFDMFMGAQGDEINLTLTEEAGGTPTCNVVVQVQPI